ncbi:GDSL-type esterase/lipase family protein [Pseudomonas sp. NBRC 111125]|uniref:GDSL-type esterase/lipase family protein n=1 Tax=Pseudomonas sp. NBRC 111125 TaxID=1661040 RepID=UPI00076139D0|nr:GDSL-type esterase/lipase family protein [Pseudomonas sp. NBRC 111125]
MSTSYTVPFLVIQASDLAVYISGVKQISGYSQASVGNPTSTVIFTTAPAVGEIIVLSLEVPFERLNDYQENGDFLSGTVNRDFDRIWLALQQLLRFAGRALTLGQFDTDGQGWYRAKGNGIRALRDPVDDQDAVTKKWAQDYVRSIFNTGQGSFNSAVNVSYVRPDGGATNVAAALDELITQASPVFKQHIKSLDYFAALMHGGQAINITCFGDSTTDGTATSSWTQNPTQAVSGFPWSTAPIANSDHNAEAPNAWPIKLQKILRAYHRNPNINVYNAGYSGQQMQNGWANYYFDKAVMQNQFIPAPNIVIIGFGLNDTTDAGNRVLQHIAQTLAVMAKVIAVGATPVLLTCDANWRSFKGWSSGTSGRDNEEISSQIDAAKHYLAAATGVSIIDQSEMQRLWMSKNSDYSNQYELQTDGLHWGDTGHSMKAGFVAQSFMPDILRCRGTDIERLSWMDSRARYTRGYESSWVPTSGDEGFKYSRFPRIWFVQPADYDPREIILDAYVWSEGNQDSLIYRNFGNSNVGSTIAQDDLPLVRVYSLDSDSPYYEKELPDTGHNEAYINATDRPFYLLKLRYGLNRIQLIAPNSNATQFWGGWFEFNPFWKAKNTFGYFNNTGAPNYVQVNALEKTGALDYAFAANPTNNRVAFMMPEIFDGTNAADIGQVGDKVEILVDGFFDTDTGFLFFGGKSLNRNSGSSDNYQEDNCLLLYATSDTFNLQQLRYPYQSVTPFPTIQTGIPGVYSGGGNRKFLIRVERVSPTVQTIKVYDGWTNINTPVLNYTGDWSQGKFCGGGVIGGVYATINISRRILLNELFIRKYK